MNDIITVDRLCKRFGDVQAVDDLSFRVREGELFAFLGVNGAGKSTTINILCGLLNKDAGQIRIAGTTLEEDPDRVRRTLGVVFQGSVLDRDLSVRDNLDSRAALYGLRRGERQARVDALAERLGFADLLSRPVGKLSGGQRRRIDIARALLHRPRILILDEPAAGLDPRGRRQVLSMIRRYRDREDTTVLLVSHSMEDIAAVADRVLVMDHGKIAMLDTVQRVFSRAEELTAMGLTVPSVTQIMLLLRQAGVDVSTDVYTVQQAAERLLPLLGGDAPC